MAAGAGCSDPRVSCSNCSICSTERGERRKGGGGGGGGGWGRERDIEIERNKKKKKKKEKRFKKK